MRKFIAAVALFIVLAALCGSVAAQTVTGTLSGHVADKTGALVPRAKVMAVNTSIGAIREAVSNEEGYFLISFLPVGTYNVVVTSAGFRSIEKRGLVIELNKTTVSDFALEVGAVTAEVEVRGGEMPLIDTTTGEVKNALNEEQIFNTPITGRNFISLVEQIPGFQPSAFNTSSNNPTNSTGSYAAFSGQGTRSTTFQIDGVNNDDSSENQNRQNVNISAIKEFQVLTNAYSAEFGRAGGAVILVQTKSGTNGFHGDAYDYIQNDLFNANDFFTNMAGGARPPVRRNQYGGTVGGPIVKNKLFFFTSVERVSNVGKGTMDRFVWLPSDTPHACAPGEVSKPGGPYCVDPATHPNMQRDLAYMKGVMDLWKTPELEGKTPNDPAACAQMIASGRPNRCVTVTGVPWTQPDSDYSGRMDWTTSNNTNMNVRYQYSRQIRLSSRIIKGDNFGSGDHKQYNIAYTLTHVFSPRQTGEFRYGFGNRATNQGVTDGDTIPILRFSGTMLYNPAASADTLNYPGTIIGTSTNVPINRRQRDHQLVYNHTLMTGRHTLRAGIDQRIQALDDIASGTQRGYWTFSSPYTSTSILSSITSATAGFAPWEMFLMGYAGSYSKGYGDPYAQNRFKETNLYLEDSFRITPSLTLNYGARWEGVSAPNEIHNKFSYGYKGDYNNIEPRVGIAWSPSWDSGFLSKITGKHGDFVIRAGYGIYHTRVFQSIFSQSGLNYRFQPPNGFTGGMASPCSYNNGGSVVAPGGTYSVNGSNWEISDPSCGYQFTKGTISPLSYTSAYTANGVKYAGGVLNTTLLIPDKAFHLPYVSQWNLTIERQLPHKMALQVGYSGNRGIGLPFFSGINDARFPMTSPLLSADVGGGMYKPVIYDRVCRDYSDPICVVTTTGGAINTATSGALRTFSILSSTSATLAQKGIVIVNGEPHGYISLGSSQASIRRPDPTIGRNYYLSNFAFTYYNAMIVKLTKATSKGLTFSGWWTWSKTMDTGSEATTTNTDVNVPVGSVNPQASLRALSSFYQKHRFVVSAAYEFPWMKNQEGFLGRMVGGWTASGVLTFASGLPFSLSAPDLNLDGIGGDYPVLVDKSVVGRSIDDGHSQNPCPSALSAGRCFDTLSQTKLPYAAFLPNGQNYVGDNIPLFPGQDFGTNVVRRNSFFQQGQKNLDFALNKNIRIAERFKLSMRMELFNALNRVTFNRPAGLTVSSTSTPLGRISGTINLQNYVNSARTSGSRMGQLALRLTF
jgi:Carboxypeptidase regulatory-like domain/TonB-dependent Receptor Plug Domain/TonB dependent receptor